MTIWMAWTLVVSTLIAFSAVLIARVASYFGVPRRYIWMAAMTVAAGAPVLLPAHAASIPWPTSSRIPSITALTSAPSSIAPAPGRSATTRATAELGPIIRRADRWIATAWALWSFVLLISLARAVLQLHRRRASWNTITTAIGRVFVATDDGPAVVGWLKPRIVMPAWALAEDSSMRALMLRHELEHLHAGDTRLLLLGEVIRRVFPWNAALWWMADQLRLAVEMDCDARVVRASDSAHAYGAMLLAVSERLGCDLPLATSPLALRGDLEQRLQAIGAKRRRHPVVASIPYVTVALIVLATAAWTPRPGFPARGRVVTVAGADSDLVRVGYAHRKQIELGFFVDGAKIDARSRVFSDALRAVPGLKVSPSGDGKTNLITSEHATDGCVRIYVDGMTWETSAPGDIDSFVNPAQLIAIEVYQPSTIPAQFVLSGGPRCAAIVAWTQAIRGRRR